MSKTNRALKKVANEAAVAAAPRLKRMSSSLWVDVFIVFVTGVLFAVAWPTLQVTHHVPAGVQPVIAGLAALPLLLIRANPALGWAISAAGALVIPLVFERTDDYDFPWQVVHVMVIMALLLAVSMRSPLAVVGVSWMATALLFLANAPGQDGRGWAVGLTALVLFGLLIRWLVLSRRELARQEEVNEVERARRAILEEKARIARDLHDVVAHHMSLVVVQAQSAPYRIEDVSPAAQAEFESIGATARDALNEIRGMLGVLRSDGQLAEDAPMPGLDRIDELVEGSRRAGMQVQVDRIGMPERLSDSAGLTMYRILQESLSNAARHAPGAPVRVTLGRDGGLATLAVVNAPPVGAAPSAVADHAGGHGITGMRDRASSVGGSLTAQPRPDGGFEVLARVPAVPGIG
ncbi:Signal transduction histidine kinase [Rhodococcus maanshanensis]|uniref:histidine kinase n=2 Tax=Rhodococcus maanshanensis TaxID=183556 RepID=A0A1H7FDN8_9NOCA|nr:Signal transduction histidine kinase [Rhodococcus maanshanensis]